MPGGEGLLNERRTKRDRSRARGEEPYPHAYPGRVPISTVIFDLAGLGPGSEKAEVHRRVAGRLLTVRHHGGSAFLPLRDQSGELQLFLRVDDLGEERYRQLLEDLDPGDIIGADGTPMVSRRGELSLRVRELKLLSKALRSPPEKWHGLKDPEVRLRQRYVDLLSSPESRRRFEGRSAIVRELRRYLEAQGFVEVETPVLAATASGALARPFVTHYNFLDADFQLRIALELPLKRLLVGGMERVFEVGKDFRNEDLDTTHSPEFTMMELYWAYADYEDVRALVEGLMAALARVAAPFRAPADAAHLLAAFTPPFARIEYVPALEKATGIPGIVDLPVEKLRELARATGARITESSGVGTCLDKLFSHHVEAHLKAPTFVFDYPIASTPLAKRHRSKPGLVERFELFYHGTELGNAYTELNDPDDQEARFLEQLAGKKAQGGEQDEVYAFDEDFVEALRYGMPPAGGLGMGVDRLTMALLGAESIKDVILFPPTRPRGAEDSHVEP